MLAYIPKGYNFYQNKKEIKKNQITELEKKNISLSIDSSFPDSLLYYKSTFKIQENSDVIIKDVLDDENYEKIENGIYTPIILLDKEKYLSQNKDITEEYNDEIYLNYTKLFKKIEKQKDDFDLFENFKASRIYVPDENNIFYKSVLDLIIYSLNDFKEPTDDELKNLYIQAKDIMNQCSTYSTINDLNSALDNSCSLIIPESYYKELKNKKRSCKYIVPLKTISYSNNFYINKNHKDFIVENLENNKQFFNVLNYRNSFIKYDLKDGYTNFNSINILNIRKDSIYEKTFNYEIEKKINQ